MISPSESRRKPFNVNMSTPNTPTNDFKNLFDEQLSPHNRGFKDYLNIS